MLKRLFGGRRTKAKWVVGVVVDLPEVAYALYDPTNPDAAIQTGVAPDIETAVDHLLTWQTNTEESIRAIGVYDRLLGRITGVGTARALGDKLAPAEVVDHYVREKGIETEVVPISSAHWLIEALQIPIGPRAGAVVDRSNLSVALRDDGETWVAGEWSDAYARNGSIGSIILRAANILAEIVDARAQISGLRTALPAAIGKENPLDFFRWVDHEAHADIAGCLAVLDAIHALSRSGDAMADRLVNLIAADIGRGIVAAVEQMRLQETRLRIHLSGRVLERIPNLRTGIVRRIELVNESIHLETVPLMNPAEALARAVDKYKY